MNIKLTIIKNYILDVVKNTFKVIRKRKYSDEYMLDKIILATEEFISWESFGRVINKFNNVHKYHYKYISQIYRLWCEHDVFKNAYTNYLNDNNVKIDPENVELTCDITCVSNSNGVENVGLNPEYTKKNVTKICFINTSHENIPISIVPVLNKTICESHKTLEHDSKCLQRCINNILIDIPSENITIQCDKGFQSQNTYTYNNKQVNISIPPKKKSLKQLNKEIKKASNNLALCKSKLQLIKTTKRLNTCNNRITSHTNKLNELKTIKNTYVNENNSIIVKKTKRYQIENYFSKIKRIPKMIIRNDKTINIFMSTIYPSIMLSL